MVSPKEIQAVILAGGKGKRLGVLGKNTPKALIKINGKVFLDILIAQLKKNGVENFLILSGYKKEKIISHFKNKKIDIVKGGENWQTLTRIINAKKFIKGPNFLLMYCDNYIRDFSLRKILSLKKKKISKVILSIVKKKNNQNGPIIIDKEKIFYQDKLNTNYTEAGYMLVNKNFFFKNLKTFKGNELSEYLKHLSKNYSFVGKYYGNNFFCIENQKLIKETKNFL